MPPKGRKPGSKNKSRIAQPKREIMYRPKRVALGGYNFTRYASTTIGTGTVFTLSNLLSENGFTFTFLLSNLRNSSDFTNLFDQYRINKVDLYFKLIQNPEAPTTTNIPATYYPTLWYIRDYDDSANMTVANMQEKQGVKRIVMKPDMINKISVTPKFQRMLYQTLTSTGYGPAQGWLDCVDASIPHYALKTTMQVPADGATWQVEVQAKYHVSFKGPQ